MFTSLYENFELTETWISPSRQEELLKKKENEKQQEIDKQNRQVVDEMIRSIIERAFKAGEAQQSTKISLSIFLRKKQKNITEKRNIV